jgi:hypothetical protein
MTEATIGGEGGGDSSNEREPALTDLEGCGRGLRLGELLRAFEDLAVTGLTLRELLRREAVEGLEYLEEPFLEPFGKLLLRLRE